MAHILWSQDIFTKGELSPLMYGRVTVNAYYQGLKTAKNVIGIPQGGAAKRFGTIFENIISGVTDYTQIFFETFQYLNECCYQILFYNNSINIYLEGQLVASVTNTGIMGDQMALMDYTILDNIFRVTTGIFPPMDLTRSPESPNAITGASGNTLTVTTPSDAGDFFPAQFTTTGTLPATVPQIFANQTYFVNFQTNSTFSIYATAQDAAANRNPFTITNAGTLSNVVILNSWALNDTVFTNLPVFDFTGGYDAITFTPSATTGYGITLTASGAIFTAAHVGGVYFGGGGIGRIISVSSTTVATINIIQPFNATTAIPGSVSLLTEPAWSNTRGWPRKCSSFQNRAFFANTQLLPNGLWASVVNEFNNFDDTLNDDDNAISWFPTSDTINYIQYIVPYRSLTVHTNSGVYSSPLSTETAITPSNFSLSLQDSTPAEAVPPRGIDNQIIIISGNDVHTLIWDGFNNAYSSNIVSIANEHLIIDPTDEAAYVDQRRAGSRYMFIVNSDGSLVMYQTLIAEDVSGFTPAYLEQSYGKAFFRKVATNFDGRGWFVTERQIATPQSNVTITGSTATTFLATGSNFSTTTFTGAMFGTAGTMPTTSPQIDNQTFYWVVGVDANNFTVYLTQEDALAATNPVSIIDFGSAAYVTPYTLVTTLMIERLDFDTYVDCAGFYNGTPISSITGQTIYNGQNISMQGDGFEFSDSVINGTINFDAHGEPVDISTAQYGFPINVEITPLPISISLTGNPKGSNLVNPQHVRFITLLLADTIGGTVTCGTNTNDIILNTLDQVEPGVPPVPQTGEFELSVMQGWNQYKYPVITINHSAPFDFKLTGIFYKDDA